MFSTSSSKSISDFLSLCRVWHRSWICIAPSYFTGRNVTSSGLFPAGRWIPSQRGECIYADYRFHCGLTIRRCHHYYTSVGCGNLNYLEAVGCYVRFELLFGFSAKILTDKLINSRTHLRSLRDSNKDLNLCGQSIMTLLGQEVYYARSHLLTRIEIGICSIINSLPPLLR